MPNTELATQLEALGVDLKNAVHSYKRLAPTLANATLYLLCLVKPPQWLFNYLLKRAEPYSKEAKMYPGINRILRLLWMTRRSMHNLFFMGFLNFPGELAYVLYKIKFISMWRNFRKLFKRSRRLQKQESKNLNPVLSAENS